MEPIPLAEPVAADSPVLVWVHDVRPSAQRDHRGTA
jgi:hypothetical protein